MSEAKLRFSGVISTFISNNDPIESIGSFCVPENWIFDGISRGDLEENEL